MALSLSTGVCPDHFKSSLVRPYLKKKQISIKKNWVTTGLFLICRFSLNLLNALSKLDSPIIFPQMPYLTPFSLLILNFTQQNPLFWQLQITLSMQSVSKRSQHSVFLISLPPLILLITLSSLSVLPPGLV